MRFVLGAFLLLSAVGNPLLSAQPVSNIKFGRDGRMTTYADRESGVELKISQGGSRVTAFDTNGKKLWTRADYIETSLMPFGGRPPSVRQAHIARFEPLPAGKGGQATRELARRLGLKGPVLIVHYSASCCGGAEGLLSEVDGKLVNTGFN